MYKLNKDLAIQLSTLYANSNYTMYEVAEHYNASIFVKKISDRTVSKSISFCIFFNLISENLQKAIIEKISKNVRSNLIYASSNYKEKKYTQLLANRDRYNEAKDNLKKINRSIEKILYIEKLKQELSYSEFVENNYENFISSDDEVSFVFPRNSEDIKLEILVFKEFISNEPLSILQAKREENLNIIRILEKKYSI